MSELKRRMKTKNIASEKKKPVSADEIPQYSVGGIIPKKPKRMPVKWLVICGIVLLLFGVVYLPEMLYTPQETENLYVMQPEIAAVKLTNEYTRDNPNEDFDGDGLVNYLEQQYGSSPRRSDSDNDGITDYAEVYLTKTDPAAYDSGLLVKQTERVLKEKGKSAGEPYKIQNVVLWADDIHSRAFGGVVRTKRGYRICNFKGWAEFPSGKYAYELKDGLCTPLKYDEKANAWRIDASCEVVLLDKPLDSKTYLTIFGHRTEMEVNFFSNLLERLLPDHAGLFICRKEIVFSATEESVTVKEITVPDWDSDLSRFGTNHNALSDLAEVYALIDDGSSVLASLNSAENGECLILIYGYTDTGALLTADPDTCKEIGVITVTPWARGSFNAQGELEQAEWYEFSGLGFDSRNYDRIHFIAASVP